MTPAQFDAALTELKWKGTDFCARVDLVPNTVWRWRKGLAPIPAWVDEYLRAVLAIQRLHAEFVTVVPRGRGIPSPGTDACETTPAGEIEAETEGATSG